MRELLQLTLGGIKHGVWKDEILSVKEIQTLNRLPLSPACIAGISLLDDRTITLADLSVCIGLPPITRDGKNRILLLSDEEKIAGFVVEGGIRSAQIPSSAIVPMPDYLRTPVITTCAVHEDVPVPIIDIALLYDRVRSADREPPAAEFLVPGSKPASLSSVKSVRVFTSGGETFAVPAAGIKKDPLKPGRASRLALMPPYVNGIAVYERNVLPLIHVSRRLRLSKAGRAALMLVAEIGKQRFGFLIDSDKGKLYTRNLKLRPVPPLTESSWLRIAAVRRRDIVPVIDIDMLMSARSDDEGIKPLPERYKPKSKFPAQYSREEVSVVEFSLLGARHALPRAEVVDTLRIKPYRPVPNVEPIVVGVAEHEGELLPVLDLAMCFGRRSIVTPAWSMMLVKNGDFRSLVITEAVFEERRLSTAQQRGVPIVLPHRVVYGCYPEAAAVRLILNVQALAVHFDKALVKEFLAALSKEMEQAPAELVPALLEPEIEAEAAEEEYAVPTIEEEEVEEEAEELVAAAAAASVVPEGISEGHPGGSAGSEELIPADASKEFAGPEATEESLEDGVSRTEEEEQEITGPSQEAAESERSVHEAVITPPAEYESQVDDQVPDAEPDAVPDIGEEGNEALQQEEEVTAVPAASEQDMAQAAAVGDEAADIDETVIREGDAGQDSPEDEQALSSDDTTIAGAVGIPLSDQETLYKEPGETMEAGPASPAEEQDESMSSEEIQDASIREAETELHGPAGTPEEEEEPEPRDSQETVASGDRAYSEDQDETVPTREVQAVIEEAREAAQAETSTVAAMTGYDREEPTEGLETASPGSAGEDSAAGRTEKRKKRHVYAVLLALLLALLYFFGISERSGIEEADREEREEPVVAEKPAALPEEEPGRLTLLVPPDVPLESNVYIVKKGDTLWHICRRFTGDPFDYPQVAADNKIPNPDLIFPDQVIVLKHRDEYLREKEGRE